MNTLQINDLELSEALDRESMAALAGGNAYHQTGATYYNGAWSGYTLMSAQYQYTTIHDGYWARKYSETWRRTRVQTEYSYWDHFVRI
ncbi:MAG TPA: hypothetical protein VGD45_12870 [Steroidobacter sp.]|jgi:hypothetical protein|uniref:hypothetical protein n=1 Tax=Steroidobacter sp. TaxID=1978227 RepID=UPI002EDA1C45